MSAITGYFNFKNVVSQFVKEDFDKSMSVQKHRGPDYAKSYAVSMCAGGHYCK